MYEQADGTKRKLTIYEGLFFLVFSIMLNSFGNGLSVASNMGSALWTASAANIAHDVHFNIGTVLIVYGILTVIINTLLLWHIEWHRIIGNLLFTIPYGLLVAFWTMFFRHAGVPELSVPIRIALTILGIFFLAVAVSMYQRVNLILHPNDDMTNIIRFKYVHGNPAIAQYLNFAIPLLVVVVLCIFFHHVVSFNIGTLFSFLFQGSLIGWSDKHIFPKLHHRLSNIMRADTQTTNAKPKVVNG